MQTTPKSTSQPVFSENTLKSLKKQANVLVRQLVENPGKEREFSELADLAKTLNSETDELNETITMLSNKISSFNLGIEVWFESTVQKGIEIGFGKVTPPGSKLSSWELGVREDWGGNIAKTTELLLKASRDLRIEGVSLVPRMIHELNTRAREKIRVMQEAKKLAAEL